MEITRLKELREERGLSQAQLAKEIGVNHRSISNWEVGAREPDIKNIKKLCKFFGITAGYLIGLEEI